MFGGLGTPEILIILVVLLLLFGSRLPNVMRSLGKSMTEFKRGMNEITDETPPETNKQESQSVEAKDEKPSDASPAG